MATAEPKDPGTKQCKDGYYGVWVWCFKETTLEKLAKPLNDVIDWPDIPWPPTGPASLCKMLYTVYMAAFKSLKQALLLPSKYLDMARQIVNYPFDMAQSLVSSALGFLDRINSLIDELLGGGEVVNDLKKLCNSVLSCPYAADTAMGKLAASILDALKDGNPITEYLQELKQELSSFANDAINQVREVPLQALSNIENAYYNMLKQMGIEDLLKHANNIAKCIKSLCTVADLGEKYYALFESTTGDGLIKKVEQTFDRAAGGFVSAAADTSTELAAKANAAKDSLGALVGYPNW